MKGGTEGGDKRREERGLHAEKDELLLNLE